MQSRVVAANRKLSGQPLNQEQQSPPIHRRGRPMCRPAWRLSTPYHAQWKQNKTSPSEISTHENPKTNHKKEGLRIKWVSPNAIRAERSEQEVAVATYPSRTKVSTPIRHRRTSRAVAHGRRILLGIFQLLKRYPDGTGPIRQCWYKPGEIS